MRILLENTALAVIDVQERLTPHIHEHQAVVERIARLIKGAQALALPIIVNEQYKKGLGETVAELKTLVSEAPHFEKVTFSSCDDEATLAHLQQLGRNNIILCGIETHVCVMQTALDLLEKGFVPIVVADATGSRFANDAEIAIQRLRQAGAVISTSESLLFELCRSSKHPAFKTISGLVK